MEGNLKLVGYKYSGTVQRVLTAAKFVNAPVVLENVNWGDKAREDLKNNTQTGTFPYLETPHGNLSEAYAIIQFLASTYNKVSLGANAWEEAQVNQWVQFAQWEITRYNKALIYPLLGFYEYNSAEAEKSLPELREWLKRLESLLQGRTHVIGDSYTIADLELFYALRFYFILLFTAEIRATIPNITSWFTTLAADSRVVSCYGRTLFCREAQKAPQVQKNELKLVGYKFSATVQRILAAAKFANAPVILENVNWGDASREELKHNSETKTFPYLETPHGTLSEAYAIVKYILNNYNKSLLGNNAWERAQINQWVEFAHWEIDQYSKYIVYPILGFSEYNKEEADSAMKELKEWLKVLNTHLNGKDFISGNRYTVADLELFTFLRAHFQLVFPEEIRKNVFPHINSWFSKLAVHPDIVSSFGRTILCKVPQKAPKVEGKKVAAKKKEEPKKKDEPKKAEKSAETGEDDEGKSSKKKPNPLDLLPPPKLVLDDFKREFLNSQDKPAVLVDFWTKYDPQDYSLWWMRYDKLPSEGKILFRTKNSMSFFLQKLDTFRKYSFAAHGIYGVEEDYDVRGVWMWRGSEIPEEFKQHESYEYMILRKLDHTKEEDRKLLESFWLNIKAGDIVDGLPVAYAETFK